MGLVHTPRTLHSIGRALLQRRKLLQEQATSGDSGKLLSLSGFGPTRPHIYQARAGLFDVDYLGHMNNAAYLTHAEFARWEWIAVNGNLFTMIQKQFNFVVASTAIRYRREVRPVFRRFQVETYLAGLDERNIWIMHNFRYPTEDRDRVRAQMIVQGVAIQGRSVIDPKTLFQEFLGMDEDIVRELTLPRIEHDDIDATLLDMMEKYNALEKSMRAAASKDDEAHRRS